MIRLYISLTICLVFAFAVDVCAQNKPGTELPIRKAKAPIKLDGILDEEDWKSAGVATNFFLNFPVDTIAPTYQSEVRITFDDQFFYVSFVCHDDDKPDVVQSLRRDFDWDLNDNIGMYLDPYNDFTNGFFFQITPFGVQKEGTMASGGSYDDSFNESWDNKWYSHVERYPDKWVAELAIPFKSFRYNISNWNVTFVRNDRKRNHVSSWIATPIQYIPAALSYSGRLVWEDQVPAPGTNISLIPYAVTSGSKNSEDNKPSEHSVNAGFDAKIGITPSLNLDLTVNPDFSNVEVDKQVINLTRFEFQFPERRQFFLENSDLFAQSGFPDTRPFFSRRIGLAVDTADDLQKVPILYGARVSGKLGRNWRIGVMNLQTQKKASLGLPDQNYSVGVIQRQVFSRSNIGLVFVNKQSLGLSQYDPSKFYHETLIRKVPNGSDSITKLSTYNRIIGADFNLFTKKNNWNGDMYYHRSFDNFEKGKNYSYGVFISHNLRHLGVMMAQNGMGKNYNPESGFAPANKVYPGYNSGFVRTEWKMYPKKGGIATMTPGVMLNYTYIPDGTVTDKNFGMDYGIRMKNTSYLMIGVNNIYQKLPEDFNPIDPKGDTTLHAGDKFQWNEYFIEYGSNSRKIFNYVLRSSGGGFYNGTRSGIGGTLSYRYQPFGSLSLVVDYNDIKMDKEYGSAKFLLLSPRLDLTFTDKLFLTSFVQYNDRYDNVNLNARFQWRFKPASDFFIVYTENYFPAQMASKNRALVLKLTYWLNI